MQKPLEHAIKIIYGGASKDVSKKSKELVMYTDRPSVKRYNTSLKAPLNDRISLDWYNNAKTLISWKNLDVVEMNDDINTLKDFFAESTNEIYKLRKVMYGAVISYFNNMHEELSNDVKVKHYSSYKILNINILAVGDGKVLFKLEKSEKKIVY